MEKQELLKKIKETVHRVEPDATIILYGSYARGEEQEDSDIDLLILVNKEKMEYKDEKKITYPLFDLGFDFEKIISPIVYAKSMWETKYCITPFYRNVKKEGILL